MACCMDNPYSKREDPQASCNIPNSPKKPGGQISGWYQDDESGQNGLEMCKCRMTPGWRPGWRLGWQKNNPPCKKKKNSLRTAFILVFRMIAQMTRMNHPKNGHHPVFRPMPGFKKSRRLDRSPRDPHKKGFLSKGKCPRPDRQRHNG